MKTALLGLGVLAALLLPGSAFGGEAFERALALAGEERSAEARDALGPVLEHEPVDAQARLLHGVLRAHEGRVGEAIEIFEALRNEHPDMLEPYNNLAVLYALEGRLEAARETLLVTLERRPDAAVYVNLGDVYTKLARRAYEHARELEAGGGARTDQELDTAFAMPAGSEPASTPSAFCARAGGFDGRGDVAEAARWLQSHGAEVLEVRHEERRVTDGYQVYLPPLQTREEAVAKLREIRNSGVRDVAVVPDGDLANGISFGIYRKAENMNRRVAALERLGYAVRSQPAELEPAGEYVVEARVGGAPAALDAAWTSRFPGQALRVVDCR